jgi:mono/diheme cytochrome c family protein
VIALLRTVSAKPVASCAVLLLLAVPLVTGCDDRYSLDMRYPPRADPVFKEAVISGDELPYPDQPGQLPVLSILNAEEPESPLYSPYKNNMLLDPRKVPPAARKSLDESLEKMFGTPARPKLEASNPGVATDLLGVPEGENPQRILRRGSRVYRIQCLHCHGLSGDGRGPTAFWVNPHPRDYRQGIFKFTSVTLQQARQKPRREDLLRTLRHGIDGSSMPAFGLLDEGDLQALVSYVIHLSLRGQVEYEVLKEVIQNGKSDTSPEEWLDGLAAYWLAAQDPKNEIIPEPYPYPVDPQTESERKAVRDAVQRGYNFFNDAQIGCVACHTNFGRDAKFRYDAWGTLTKPADLTVGIYRGGRRPIDLYYRMHSGINGSGMAAFGSAAVGSGKVKSLWDIVKFVEILPYPQMRAEYGVHID